MTARAALPCSVLAALFLPGFAHADEGEWVLGIEPQLGLFSAAGDDAELQLGAGGQLSFWIGLSDAAWLFVAGGVEVGLDGGPTVGEGIAGAVAALDVLRTIPFIELGAGADLIGGELAPLLRLGVGADYLITPDLSFGAVARYRPLFGREGESWLTFSLRLGFRGDF